MLDTVSKFLCNIFTNNCERDALSGIQAIRDENGRILAETGGVNAAPFVQSYFIMSRPGTGFGTPSIARFTRYQIPTRQVYELYPRE